jgi:hypothetical protein
VCYKLVCFPSPSPPLCIVQNSLALALLIEIVLPIDLNARCIKMCLLYYIDQHREMDITSSSTMGCAMSSLNETFGSIDETWGSTCSASSCSFDSLRRVMQHSALQDEDSRDEHIGGGGSHPRSHRKVSFNLYASVREYKVVIGDHPSCKDALPLSLDWSFEDSTSIPATERSARYSLPKRLTYVERKLRLKRVGGFSEEALCQRESLHLGQRYDDFWGSMTRLQRGAQLADE